MVICLAPGEKIEIQFQDTDGSFEVHYDSPEHPQSITVKETGGFSGNVCGKGDSILYQETFGDDFLDKELVNPEAEENKEE